MIDIDGSNAVEFAALCNTCSNAACRSCKTPSSNRLKWRRFISRGGDMPDCVVLEDGWYTCAERKEKVKR